VDDIPARVDEDVALEYRDNVAVGFAQQFEVAQKIPGLPKNSGWRSAPPLRRDV
jgi:hypothetical protein